LSAVLDFDFIPDPACGLADRKMIVLQFATKPFKPLVIPKPGIGEESV
jgi:hypothetical protein